MNFRHDRAKELGLAALLAAAASSGILLKQGAIDLAEVKNQLRCDAFQSILRDQKPTIRFAALTHVSATGDVEIYPLAAQRSYTHTVPGPYASTTRLQEDNRGVQLYHSTPEYQFFDMDADCVFDFFKGNTDQDPQLLYEASIDTVLASKRSTK